MFWCEPDDKLLNMRMSENLKMWRCLTLRARGTRNGAQQQKHTPEPSSVFQDQRTFAIQLIVSTQPDAMGMKLVGQE